MKVVINTCFGGFDLSAEAKDLVEPQRPHYMNELPCNFRGPMYRSDPALVSTVETLGEKANGEYAQLKVVEIPDDVRNWYITEMDGNETIREGRRWR